MMLVMFGRHCPSVMCAENCGHHVQLGALQGASCGMQGMGQRGTRGGDAQAAACCGTSGPALCTAAGAAMLPGPTALASRLPAQQAALAASELATNAGCLQQGRRCMVGCTRHYCTSCLETGRVTGRMRLKPKGLPNERGCCSCIAAPSRERTALPVQSVLFSPCLGTPALGSPWGCTPQGSRGI